MPELMTALWIPIFQQLTGDCLVPFHTSHTPAHLMQHYPGVRKVSYMWI